MMKHVLQQRFLLAISVVTLVTFLTRFIFIDIFPSLLLQDEAGLGYSGISIAETGKDEWGVSWPLLFKSFGEYKAGAYIYITAGLYHIVGWHPALARYASALAGTFLVPALCWLVYLVTRSKNAAFIAGVLVLTSPWAFHLGRQAVETNVALFFFVVGLCFFVQKKDAPPSIQQALPAALFFALSVYTYQVYKLFVPLFLLGYVAIFNYHLSLKQHFTKNSLVISVLTALFVLPLFFTTGGATRLQQVISIKPEVVEGYVTLRRDTCYVLLSQTGVPKASSICHMLWNSYTAVVSIVWNDTLEHLSPAFLFFVGDTSINRNPTLSGAFFFFLMPFFLMGIIDLLKKDKHEGYILVGLVLALVPSIIAGTPHALRLTPLFPFVIVCIVVGIERIKYRYISLAVPLAACFFFIHHTTEYAVASYANSQEFLSYSKEVSQQAYTYWQNGYTVYLDHRIMPEPHIFVAYWNAMPPTQYQSLVSNVLEDAQNFTRPRKLSDTFILDQIDARTLICSTSKAATRSVLITNDPLPFKGVRQVFSETKVHKFATFYEIEQLPVQSQVFTTYCSN